MSVSAPKDPLAPGLILALRIDNACLDFEASWRRAADGSPPPMPEQHLTDLTEPGRTALLVELLRLDAFYRRRSGQCPEPADYLARFPDLDPAWLEEVLAPEASLATAITPLPGVSAASKPVPFRAVSPPTAVEGYQLLEMLGRGGMGVVYKARHKKLDRTVALKMILGGGAATADEVERFRREALAVAKLQHPNIVQVYEVGELPPKDGQPALPYLALEYVDGGNLGHHVGGTPQPPAEAARIVEALADAVQHAHERGIIHRDLKPANVLLGHRLSASGERPESSKTIVWPIADSREPIAVKITDFGLAKDLGATNGQTQSGALLGTPQYMAPEQAEGNLKLIGPLTDVYALGGILYFLLTGRPPVQGTDLLEVIEQVRFQDPVPPRRLQPRVPRDVETICLKCLAKSMSQRYASAAALAADLRRFLNGEPILARPTSRLERLRKWSRRQPMAAGSLAAGALAAVVLVAVLLLSYFQIRHQQAATQTAYANEREANNQLRETNIKLQEEEAATKAALAKEAAALKKEAAALKDERFTGYLHRVALARNEWVKNNIPLMMTYLKECPEDLRQSEWHYLRRLGRTDLATYCLHKGRIQDVVFSPNGQLMASCCDAGMVQVVDLTTNKIMRTWREKDRRASCLCFHPDNTRLLVLFGGTREQLNDTAVHILNLDKQAPIRTLHARDGQFSSPLAVSPDGNLLAVDSHAKAEHHVEVWNVAEEKRVFQLPANRHGSPGISFSHDGRWLACGGQGGPVQVWEMATGKLHAEFAADRANKTLLGFQPDGRLWLGSDANRLGQWDVASQLETRHTFVRLSSPALCPQGSRLAYVGNDKTVRILLASTLQEVQKYRGHAGTPQRVVLHPDRTRLASASNSVIKLWTSLNAAERAVLEETRPLTLVAPDIDPTKTELIEDDPAGLGAEELRTLRGLTSGSPLFAEKADGRLQAIGRPSRPGGPKPPAGIQGGNPNSKEAPFQLPGLTPAPATFGPDGKRMAPGDLEGPGRPWDVHGRQFLQDLPAEEAVQCLALDRFGTHLATGHVDGSTRIWDLAIPSQPRILRPNANLIPQAVCWSPDGQRLAVGYSQNTTCIWGVNVGQTLHVLQHPRHNVHRIAFLAQGSRLATADNTGVIKLWDPVSGRETLTLVKDDE